MVRPRRMRRFGIATLVLTSAAVAALIGAGTPAQSATTCGGGAYFHTGRSAQASSAVWGARATIEDFDPDLCSTASASSVWALVAAPKSGNASEIMYAQAGYLKVGQYTNGPVPAGWRKFAQYAKSCSPGCAPSLDYVTWWSDAAPTGPLTYVATYRQSDDRIHMYSNGVDVLQTTYDPVSVWTSQWTPQYYAETWHAGTDIVGSSGNKTSLWNLQVYDSSENTSFPANWIAPSAGTTRHFGQITYPGTGGEGMDLWTYPIS